MRKSSKASGWLPEGPGFQVFESAPTTPPPIAPSKTPPQWGQPAIEATIRAWYSFMAIESRELKQVKDEWEARFAALPSDTDVSQIDESLRLRWRALPKCSSLIHGTRPENAAHARQRGGPLDGVSPALENPPINPLTGPGRTAADVARDANAWRAHVRQQSHELKPVFQGDYLFVLPPNQTLQLHRVASGAFIEDALSPDIHFQTSEYQQTPHTQLGGFWGEFSMKSNPDHNPANKKMGGMFVRHNEITRGEIKVYDVRVVIVKHPPPSGTEACDLRKGSC